MSANFLTIASLDALSAILAESAHAVRLIKLRAEAGEISPEQAAAELKPVLERISNCQL